MGWVETKEADKRREEWERDYAKREKEREKQKEEEEWRIKIRGIMNPGKIPWSNTNPGECEECGEIVGIRCKNCNTCGVCRYHYPDAIGDGYICSKCS